MSRRALRPCLAALAALLLSTWLLVAVAPSAQAASRDVFDSFDVVATLDSDGYVHVTETIVLRFGSSSGRHGLERTLITREPDGDDYDVEYQVDQVSVTSPSGVSIALDTSEQGSGRNTYLRIRVGSANRTISAATATYVLSYRVLGLMRTQNSYDELYWDVTGASMPRIGSATAKITVPGGAQDVFCSVALPGSAADCDRSELNNGVAEFSSSDIPTGDVMTVSVKIGSGLVAHNAPIRVENALRAEQRQTLWTLGGGVAAASVVPFLGWWYLRRRSRDYRWQGLPPGSFPALGQQVPEVLSSEKIEIPVTFAPPRLAVAEAGLLIDGRTQVRDTTAALVSLAVAGAVQLRSDEVKQVRLVDPSRAPDETSAALLRTLFPSKKSTPGKTIDLGEPGTLTKAHDLVTKEVRQRAGDQHWFVRLPGTSGRWGSALLFPVVVLSIMAAGSAAMSGTSVSRMVLVVAPLAFAFWITAYVVGRKLRRGQRTAYGRALTDQVEGFRTYLATAEAEQLQFEEGEDIYSRYLPWAIMFDLTARWTKVCQRLVEIGRLPETSPTWYYGTNWSLNNMVWQMSSFNTSVGSSIATPAPTFSESGFGSGGSAFGGGGFGGGGGFSGGGGGGGGGGSW